VWFGDGYGYGDCIVRIRCCFVQGLEATEDIITHQPLIEYIGNVMLRDQFYNGETPFERYVMYVSSPYMEKKYPPRQCTIEMGKSERMHFSQMSC